VKEVDDEISLEDPRDCMVEPLRDEFCFEDPYDGAKYRLVVSVDVSNQKLVPSETEHPRKSFVGRKIRKWFDVKRYHQEAVDENLCWCGVAILSRKTVIQDHVR
jgi:hypothetical protein